MPIFEYRCGKCGHVFEHFTFGEEKAENKICPQCREPGAQKIMSPFSACCGGSEESGWSPGGGCGSGKPGFS